MDGRSRKKIRRYIACFAVFVLFLVAGSGLLGIYAARIQRHQLEELMTLYPELSAELLANFQYYGMRLFQYGVFFLLALLVLIVLFGVFLFVLWDKSTKQEREDSLIKVQAVCEQLEQFRKGNFQRNPFFSEPDNGMEEGVWLRISELLRELGYYFADLKEQLAKEENSTKSLITDISHQLKTPLASLRLSYELTREEALTDAERKEFIEKEEQEILRLELLLEELVKLSRLENHMIQIEPEPASIKKTITDAVSRIILKAHGKQMELRVEIPEDIMVNHDPNWTAEVLENVLDNAVKYSEPQSVVEVRVTGLPGNVLMEIEDEGMGIPEEELYHIFERFYRGKAAGQRVKEGTGVGLYLARNILERQGGTITAKRKQGRGTIFSITLPRIKE